jgi:hypothetical protein
MNFKKTLILFSLLSSFAIQAQITKGNFLVGGSGSIYNSKAKDESSVTEGSGFNISGNCGYFLIDKFAIGLMPSIGYAKTNGNNDIGKGFGLSIFTRYYFLKAENRINLFSQLQYGYSSSYNGKLNTATGNNFTVKAGPAIYFNSSVALEVTLNYENFKLNSKQGSESTTTFRNLNIGVGFQIHLEKK